MKVSLRRLEVRSHRFITNFEGDLELTYSVFRELGRHQKLLQVLEGFVLPTPEIRKFYISKGKYSSQLTKY